MISLVTQDISPFSAFFLLVIVSYIVSIVCLRWHDSKTPLVGSRSLLEARLIVNFRFFKDAASIINEGYYKFKDSAFRFARNDADMIVLPLKYVDEVQAMPNYVANPTLAHAHNLLGRHTDMGIILRSNLHFRIIQTKLTPNLGSLTAPMQEELDYALTQDFPPCRNDWIRVEPYHLLLKLVARISARVFVGLPICRQAEWLEASVQFTENVFVTVCLLRLFPTWMHPVVSNLMPSRWRSYGYIQTAKKLLIPEIIKRRQLEAEGRFLDGPGNLLSWMMECATETEKDPAHLAHLEIVISLASIHTSQMNAVHVLYDLAARPEYLQPLRDEIAEVYRQDGGLQKTSFAKLRKLDSFLKESQRFNPPSLLSYHRVMQQSHVLKDGTVLPQGSHICMAVNAIQNDPNVTPSPDVFDGFRYYKLRQMPGESHMHQFAMTESSLLNFGHGKYACPGRFFASLEIKIILTRLIMNYDFKLAGDGRPANVTAHEFIFPNPAGEILVRERAKEDQIAF